MMMMQTATMLAEFPRYELLRDPTLLQRLERTEAALKHRGLYIKRDDLMPIAMGGNKLRSLEFWLGAAFQVRFVGVMDEARRMKAVEHAAAELQLQGRRPYIVGNAAIGALGYVRAAEELFAQSRPLNLGIRHVMLPGSMGTTEAGLIFGNALLGYPFEVHLVSVEYGEAELSACVRRAYAAVANLVGKGAPDFDERRVHYHMNYLGLGYACPTPQGEEAILILARTEGIVLEHIYTAKTFACFLDLARRHEFPDAEPVCVIHTGGVPALFSQFEIFRSVTLEQGGER
jgi:1-aminocyclopropane-1-carboxylate deaminase/D-cysteine desulfhydrase-like pyridoxal-dependent ACC family enzyme